MATIDERLAELEQAQQDLLEAEVFLTGRITMFTQQLARAAEAGDELARVVRRNSENATRGFTDVAERQRELARRVDALEAIVARLEAPRG